MFPKHLFFLIYLGQELVFWVRLCLFVGTFALNPIKRTSVRAGGLCCPAPVLQPCCRARVRCLAQICLCSMTMCEVLVVLAAPGVPAAWKRVRLCLFPSFFSCEVALKGEVKENVWIIYLSGLLTPLPCSPLPCRQKRWLCHLGRDLVFWGQLEGTVGAQ